MSKIRILSSLDNLPVAVAFLKKELHEHNLSSEDIHDIELSFEEILVNVFSYAYTDSKGEVELSVDYIPDHRELHIYIRDWGLEFNVLDHPEPDVGAPLEMREKGGLGIFLTKRLMDDVRYQHDGESNTVTLVKRLAPA